MLTVYTFAINKSVKIQFFVAIALGVLFMPLMKLWEVIFDAGFHLVGIALFQLIFFQVLFYLLLSTQKFWVSLLNFAINFVLWFAELYMLAMFLDEIGNPVLPEYFLFINCLFLGSLWLVNKMILDNLLAE